MDRNEFFQNIKIGKIANAYLFQGPENYVKHRALTQLRGKLLPEGFEQLNETILEGVSAMDIIEAAETLPLMCERRLVVVRDWAPLTGGKAKNEQEEAERIAEWLKNTPDSCCTVFYMRDSADKRKKTTQLIVKQLTAVQFTALDSSEAAKWVRNQAKTLGISIELNAINRLLFMTGLSLINLEAEFNKLSAYVHGRTAITMADIEAVVTPSLECTVFQLIDKLMEKRMVDVERLLKHMLEAGETVVGILAMITRQMRMLTHIKLLGEGGMKLPEIEKRLELNHYGASQAAHQARNFSLDSLEKGYQACVEADYSIKSGMARDRDALYSLLFHLQDLT